METDAHVLPLAYGSARGNTPEAAATLLLNQLTRTVLGENATYLSDALATLGITDLDAPRRLEPALQAVIEDLGSGGRAALNTAYQLIPGMTVHRAKGREWSRVGIRLSEKDRATLAAGLRVDNERHRQLYVACTRARFSTTSV